LLKRDELVEMKKFVGLAFLLCVLLPACHSIQREGTKDSNPASQVRPLKRITQDGEGLAAASKPTNVVQGQIIYVPAYSHIYEGKGDQYLLSVTLSIRNTSLTTPILIRSIRYHDSVGKLVKEYAKGYSRLAPLASTEFFIPDQDTSGGAGANFIVEWVAEQTVTEPIVETVMISTSFQQGISFTAAGRVKPSN